MENDEIIGMIFTITTFAWGGGMVFALMKHYKSLPVRLQRERRIDALCYMIDNGWFVNSRNKLNETKYEELVRLRKERENENRDILDSAKQQEKLISDLKNEIEELKNKKNEKNEKIENEKLLKIVSEQKSVILDLEMELKIKKSAHEKLVY
ncbi:MAG: hypothetical protein FWF51_03015 [Chitinivibrionia bacterium]|nr:hypothetical protein [Chitinivibrionia bacterium]